MKFIIWMKVKYMNNINNVYIINNYTNKYNIITIYNNYN